MATIRTTRGQQMAGSLSETVRRNQRRSSAVRDDRARPAARPLSLPIVQDRVFPVFILVVALHVALAIRLAHLQIWRNADLTLQAEKLREKKVTLAARRGTLMDRNGSLLVQNQPAYNIEIDPNSWFANLRKGETPEARQAATVDSLSRLLKMDVAAIVAQKEITRGKTGRYRTISIAKEVDQTIGERVKAEGLLGVGVRTTARRTAVLGDLAPHIIGFTGSGGQGLNGLEHGLEHGLTYTLTGSNGLMAAEFDSRGVIPGTIKNHRPAQHGSNFVLTIDSGLQQIVQDALKHAFTEAKAEAATAVVLDPKTGDILALANYPAFDVNHWKTAPEVARMNRAVSAPYEPGSTLKVVTLAGAIEDHKIGLEDTFFCPGYRQVGRRKITCHDHKKHGDQNATMVLANSCNVATAEIGTKLGRTRLFHYLKAFGFGERSKCGLPGEEPGNLKTPDRWEEMRFANIAFGQGMSVTPLQLAAAYATIANDGIYHRPRIVLGVQDDIGQMMPLHLEEGRRVLSVETARTMQRMLHAVIEQGTGKPARLDGYTAGGKTATAQLTEKGKRGYGSAYVSSFAGIAPAKNAQFVILVSVTKPKGAYYGGTVAGPVFKEIAEKALLARRVPRDGVVRTKSGSRDSDSEDTERSATTVD